MKRARDPSDDSNITHQNGLDGNQRVTPGFLNQSPVPSAAEDDDDPYGFGKVGAPGFVSKPTSMKAGFVPGYLRIPGSSGAMAPGAITAKSARTALTGPGAKPMSALRPTPAARPTMPAQAEAFKVPAVPAAIVDIPEQSAQPSAVPPVPDEKRHQQNLALQRKRVQNKDLPEQHRLPDDLPAVVPASLAKTSASATGPISAQAQPLPGFHAELETFVEKASPTEAEQLTKAAAFERIKSGCLAPFPRSQYALVNVQPFGSYANGLSLAASDIDVVITGVTYPDDGRGGYIKESRKPVTDQLFKVVKQLRAQHAVARGGSALQIISGARIPIIKLTTVEGTEVDISLGSDDGVKAAEIIKAKLQEFPLARPLTIVIKAFLKARRLTDVSSGGLGGYALVNMVIAHLQEEAKGNGQALDLGQLLMGFFRRFGSHFNLYTDAVAIGSGGICPKKSVCQFEEDILAAKLCVQDISTLRDVASGSKRITEVSEAFHSSAETLEQQAKTYQDEPPADGWLQLLFETTPFTMREAVEVEEELPQQSGRPSLLQARPHIMMPKSQPKQHGEPGFMMRKSGQSNHKPYASGQQGFAGAKNPHSNSRTVIASPPPRPGSAALSPLSSPGSASKSVSPSQAPAYFHATTASPNGGPGAPGIQSPALHPKPAAAKALYSVPSTAATAPYNGMTGSAAVPYGVPPTAASTPYSMAPNTYQPPAGYDAASVGLPPSLSPWTAPHAAAHPYSMAAYQYQMAQQMSAQMTSYMMAQSMPMAYPAVPAMGMRPPGPRPPPGSPPPKH